MPDRLVNELILNVIYTTTFFNLYPTKKSTAKFN